MYYDFCNDPLKIEGERIIATSLNGVCYTENDRLYIRTVKKHLVYKYDGSPVGWYVRNLKTLDDIYLGEGACPSAEFETLSIKESELWNSILRQGGQEPTEEK